MAVTVIQSVQQADRVILRVLVDNERNKVVYAEAGKDFVDALFSFLTLPLGTIARLVAKESNIQQVTVGSLSSLYQSVANLDEQYLWTHACKEMLLEPRNFMEAYFRHMKLNIDHTEPTKYFVCEKSTCYSKSSSCLFSTFRNQRCTCGSVMSEVVIPDNCLIRNWICKETASYIIFDDLSIMPNVIGTSVHLLQNLGVQNIQAIEERTLLITRNEACLLSL
ncbi:hypothetical protein TSUD_163100 [Trifolium subterraneum]|uniref:DUF674 family protein n=1 Tax=Trifolium subterraneum TaxID=3900 RepID=A0A2Z6N8W8_TRISU|nr:hypothetical protein TSUD_163100 [Trifolium subterraneum]